MIALYERMLKEKDEMMGRLERLIEKKRLTMFLYPAAYFLFGSINKYMV
jgi:hypothetical protein